MKPDPLILRWPDPIFGWRGWYPSPGHLWSLDLGAYGASPLNRTTYRNEHILTTGQDTDVGESV